MKFFLKKAVKKKLYYILKRNNTSESSMGNLEYQDKIISLLRELSDIFGEIGWTLGDIIRQSNETREGSKVLKENETIEAKEKLIKAINIAWNIIDKLSTSIKEVKQFENVDEVSKEILDLISDARYASKKYERASEKNLLDEGIENNKEAMLNALKDISDYIIEYNKKFEPKLKTLKQLLKEAKRFDKLDAKRFYEEIFGRN